MTMEVVVISREIIRPFSATPDHLRSYKLSLIDQFTVPKFYVPLILCNTAQVQGQLNQVLTSPAFYIPLILFYPADDYNKFENTKMSDRLKKSLSAALSKFYPLAGRLGDGDYSVNCNDNGVEYLESRVSCLLNQVLGYPEAVHLNQLLPCDLHCNGSGFDGLLAVQVNIFDCGGIAIAVCMSHIPADASSLCTFINTWANIARGDDITDKETPIFRSASIFLPKEVLPSTTMTIQDGGAMEKLPSKRFVFSASKIAALRAKCVEELCQPTRVEVVSALIWKCLMNVIKLKPASTKLFTPNVVVNLRSRMSPPLFQHSFGNLVMCAIPPASKMESETELHCLVGQLQKCIRDTYGDNLKKLQLDADAMFDHLKKEKEFFLREDVEAYIFTSWCRFPYYKADFGWGDPIWVSSVNLILKNTVTLMDTKETDGIEAWVTLDAEDMARFECQKELLAFASLNPMVSKHLR